MKIKATLLFGVELKDSFLSTHNIDLNKKEFVDDLQKMLKDIPHLEDKVIKLVNKHYATGDYKKLLKGNI